MLLAKLTFSCPSLSSLIDSYISAEDNRIVTVCAKEESGHLMTITKMRIDVQSVEGAKEGLVFLSSEDLSDEKHAEKMKEFNSWTLADYKKIDRTMGRKWWV